MYVSLLLFNSIFSRASSKIERFCINIVRARYEREGAIGENGEEDWKKERERERSGAKNLLQNNKLSPDDFCRRVFRGWLLPEVTSLFLTDDAIIQVLGDVQENGLPRPRLALCRAPRVSATWHSVWFCYSIQLNA